MTLTADQYFQVSQGYALAAADPFIPPDRREAFAKKAEWFEFLGRREGGNSDLEVRRLAGELGDSERPRRSMSPPGTTLRLTGAALALIGTLLFTNALNLFGTNDRQDVAIELDRSLVPALKVASVAAKATEQDKRQFQPTADRAPQEELSSPSPPPEPIEDLAAAPPPEVLKVTTNARIRNGPSTNAEKIGTATLGTAIQVKSREGAWVQFVDSSSGKIGWIHSSLVGRR